LIHLNLVVDSSLDVQKQSFYFSSQAGAREHDTNGGVGSEIGWTDSSGTSTGSSLV
jgi:hypothetical protein